MQRRKLLAGMGASTATVLAGCMGSGGNGSGDPTDSDSNPDSEGSTPALPEPSLDVGDFTCSEEFSPIDVTLENGAITFEGLANASEYDNCIGFEAGVRWGGENNEGDLVPQLQVTSTDAPNDCPDCDAPSYRHREFTYTIETPDEDYWTGRVVLQMIGPGGAMRSLAEEEFDQ